MTGLALLAVVLFLYAVASKRMARTALSGPMLFTALGLATGPQGLGLIDVPTDSSVVLLLLEGTLVLVLFTDALGADLAGWRTEISAPARLLGIGLPLTLLAGWALAVVLFPDLAFWEAGLVAIVLTPTDAALGMAVVANRRVPGRIRHALNVESGLNDGLMLPVFFIALGVAVGETESLSVGSVAGDIALDVLVATVVGAVLGRSAAAVIAWADARDWTSPGWRQISMLTLAFAAWAVGDALGGSGFISAWVAGFVVGRQARAADPRIAEFAEQSGHMLTMLSFFVFGAAVLGRELVSVVDDPWRFVLYAVLSLTAVRLLPVALSMAGMRFRPPSVAYLGWFGPRGLASIILVLTILEEADLPGIESIRLAMAATVTLSIVAHGVTAWWGSNRYADWYEKERREHPGLPEGAGGPDGVRVSRRLGHAEEHGDPAG
jgi:NhaP-type Na+/H+ or K+/H+ antiporter